MSTLFEKFAENKLSDVSLGNLMAGYRSHEGGGYKDVRRRTGGGDCGDIKTKIKASSDASWSDWYVNMNDCGTLQPGGGNNGGGKPIEFDEFDDEF